MAANLMKTKSAIELAQLLKTNQVTSAELINELTETININNERLNAVTHLWHDHALELAKSVSADSQFGGVPILLKGLGQGLAGEIDSGSSKLLKDARAPQTNNFVKRLLEIGLIPVGATNAPEFGFKNITDSELYGNARNPWNLDYFSGGSSGGAASAISDSWLPIATASDGGGSIRIPSSFSGTIGLKPTRGRVPTGPDGWRGWQGASINFAITKFIDDTAQLLDGLSTVQMAAPFQVPLPAKPFATTLTKLTPDVGPIAFSTKSPVGTTVSEAAVEAVTNAVSFLEDQGFDLEEVDAPIDGVKLMQSYYQMNAGETATMFASMPFDDATIKQKAETLTWALGYTGKGVSAIDYSSSLTFWDETAATMDAFATKYPLYLTPATAHTAPRIDTPLVSPENYQKMEHIEDYNPSEQLQIIWDQWLPSLTLSPFTQLANISGQPAISLPTHVSKEGLPIGIQFMARKGREDLILNAGKLFESAGLFEQLK
ncbi:amidase family protein [Lentilactobacillus sp. Marseille-Q4993]|uniref:amidase family protein n=1 Tax=Lentilactobacillus sp. Marseille-Q4993 TaxID=3039492 RepID=UPI0024BD2E8E|nr:amidase family protein [Lentilactobacillus sp. Marseille-Q4993]